MALRTIGTAVGLGLVMASAASCRAPSSEPPPAPGTLALALDRSAASAGVPRDMLVAIAAVEGGLGMPRLRTALDVDSEVPAAGPLMLRRGKLNTLARGAALVGRTELELRQDADLALEAGALVLAELAARDQADVGDGRDFDAASWERTLEEMSGYGDDAHRADYARRVLAQLARGGAFEGRDGERVELPSHDVPPSAFATLDTSLRPLAKAQYPGAEFFPTDCDGKCTTTRGGNKVTMIVVHDTEGGWDASVATLQNDPGKSCHYIVDTDGKVGQFVEESVTAWHAGNFHYNQRSIGIEHVGYSTKPYPEAQYTASVALVSHLAKKYGVAIDRSHVIGHDQIPDGSVISASSAPCSMSPRQCRESGKYGGAANHTDPGVWEWPTFMKRLGGAAKCNDAAAVWVCSSDGTRAFRCKDEQVEVMTCAAPCEPMPSGTDDRCEPAPADSPDEPAPGDVDASAPDTDAGEPDGHGELPTGATVGPEAPVETDAGCALAPGATPGGRGVAVKNLALVVATLLAVRRKRAMRPVTES